MLYFLYRQRARKDGYGSFYKATPLTLQINQEEDIYRILCKKSVFCLTTNLDAQGKNTGKAFISGRANIFITMYLIHIGNENSESRASVARIVTPLFERNEDERLLCDSL